MSRQNVSPSKPGDRKVGGPSAFLLLVLEVDAELRSSTIAALRQRIMSGEKQEDAKNVAEDCTKIVDLHASMKTSYVTTSDA